MAKSSPQPQNGKQLKPEPEAKALKVNLTFPRGTESSFSNYMTVLARGDGLFHLSFFEIDHPMILRSEVETEEDYQKKVEELECVNAPCVAKLVVSAEQMKRMIGALADNYDRYEEDLKKSKQHDSTEKREKNAG